MDPAIHDLIQKLKTAVTSEDRERLSVDLETATMLACDAEMIWRDPVIITQGARTYRAYPI